MVLHLCPARLHHLSQHNRLSFYQLDFSDRQGTQLSAWIFLSAEVHYLSVYQSLLLELKRRHWRVMWSLVLLKQVAAPLASQCRSVLQVRPLSVRTNTRSFLPRKGKCRWERLWSLYCLFLLCYLPLLQYTVCWSLGRTRGTLRHSFPEWCTRCLHLSQLLLARWNWRLLLAQHSF